jgi:acetolactate synthase-1/2/3 large subunit
MRANALTECSQPAGGTAARVTDAIAGALADAGVTIAFALPGGGSNLPLVAALDRRGVRTVLVRSETGGAMMASTVADITDGPAVLVVGLGPGVASAVNGVAHARLDRSPLLVIADRYADDAAGTTGHQLLDHTAILGSVVKATIDAPSAGTAQAVRDAVATALAAPRGPVLIELRRDRASVPPACLGSTEGVARAGPDELTGDFAGAAAALSRATCPVLLVGEEARHGVTAPALTALAERLAAPVLATYKAKGTFPESHPLAAGIVTGAAIERPLLARADVFVGVGLDPVELLAQPWPFGTPMVALRTTADVDPYLVPRWTIAGDLRRGLQRLTAELGPPPRERERNWGKAGGWYPRLRDRLRTENGTLSAWRVVEIAQELTGDPVVTVDAGAHMFAATWFWRSERPNRFHISNGLATMGFAVPAAIGAAIAAPQETVLAFTGDGGFTINMAELETAARAQAKVIVLVINDAGLGLIRVKQAELGARRSAVDFARSDFASVAEGLGVRGARATDGSKLRAALADALAASETTVIDIAVTGGDYADLHRLIRTGG